MVCSRSLAAALLVGFVLPGWSAAETLDLVDARDQLVLLDADHWKVGDYAGRAALILHTAGDQRPPVRRPSEFALLKRDKPMGTFSVEAATLEPESTIHRDVCLIFGYRDDTHFYYAHLSSNSDNKVHNIIMRVDGDSRTRINRERDPEPRLSNGWHTIKVEHAENGAIQVYMDDMEKPLMTAEDTTYPQGKIGFGSFDDRAAFTSLRVQ